MFKVAKVPTRGHHKKSLTFRIIAEAYDELQQMAEKNNIKLHSLLNQIIYHILDRDQVTGEKLKQEG